MELKRKKQLLTLLKQFSKQNRILKEDISWAKSTLKLTNKYPELEEDPNYADILDSISKINQNLQNIIKIAEQMSDQHHDAVVTAVKKDITDYMAY